MSVLSRYMRALEKGEHPIIKRYIEIYEEDYNYLKKKFGDVKGAVLTKYITELIADDVDRIKKEEGSYE